MPAVSSAASTFSAIPNPRFGLPEKVVNNSRNHRSFCSEIGGHLFPKQAVIYPRNPQV
jgi:hypothetical protein